MPRDDLLVAGGGRLAEKRAHALVAVIDRLDAEAARLRQARRARDAFLAAYLPRIEPMLRRLRTLSGEALPMPAGRDEPCIESREAKRLYRRLMRACHPDLGAEAHAALWLPVVQHAYRHGNLASLWKLSLRIEAISPAMSLEAITLTAARLVAARQAIEASDAWRLMRRIEEASEHGVDLFATIVERIAGDLRREESLATLRDIAQRAQARRQEALPAPDWNPFPMKEIACPSTR